MGGALAIINENLAFWPRKFVNKVKERLVRLHQYLIRYRKWYYRAKYVFHLLLLSSLTHLPHILLLSPLPHQPLINAFKDLV